ncbi:MAG: radical SAM family heme chaperone HemW [Gammaproteobacteria bacterium]|jgi:oxygen-independent coproporphyrinogen-3 oxidase
MFEFAAPPPLSLYIHFPWCVRKCPYCDFNSHALRESLPEQAYVDALLADLEQELPLVWGRTVQTVFMGGGTPSLFSAQAVEHLLSAIRARLPLSPNAEITLEANPGTVEQEKFAAYREAGVNRLSIGVQSFSAAQLHALGRIHSAGDALEAARAAREAGFDNFNLDLMFGLPGQTVEQALDDLATATDLEPAHLSWYQLTIEPNTLFHKQPPQLPDDDRKWDIQQAGQSLLAGQGYTQYEVSAYARAGRRCRHNLNYWRFGDYIGIGAGAHGKLTDGGHGRIVRRWKKRHPRDYLATAADAGRIEGQRRLAADDAVFEFALNRLRLREGFTLEDFRAASGLAPHAIRPLLEQAEDAGLLTLRDDHVAHTETGWRFLDDLIERFLAQENRHDREQPH